MNILWIMFDQLRFDYLSCAGHPTLQTPNIDRLARKGVRFTNAYTQSPVCGAARMSAYTGRYVSSHGAQWNGVPLKVGEPTLGDHLRANGTGCCPATGIDARMMASQRFIGSGAIPKAALTGRARSAEECAG